jgi:hypothetical protein
MTEHERVLAENCYGYGNWNAPYWFVGPEQGQGDWEDGKLERRYRAFIELGKDGLSDCFNFHQHIGETRWCSELQSTWKRLILILLAYKGLPTENDKILSYQCRDLGNATGETCVIELSGLPAKNFSVTRDRKSFREKRIQEILSKARAAKPKFIVIYGKSQRKYWENIESNEPNLNIRFEPHPVRGPARQFWLDRAAAYKINR